MGTPIDESGPTRATAASGSNSRDGLSVLEQEKLRLEIAKLADDRRWWRQPSLYISLVSSLTTVITLLIVLGDKSVDNALQQSKLDAARERETEILGRLSKADSALKVAEVRVNDLEEEDARLNKERDKLLQRLQNANKNYDAVIQAMVATMKGSVGKSGTPRVSVPIRIENRSTVAVKVQMDANREVLTLKPQEDGLLLEARLLDAPTLRVLEESTSREYAVVRVPPLIDTRVRLFRFDGTSLGQLENLDSPFITPERVLELLMWAADKARHAG